MNISKRFDQCPVCESKERFFEQMGNELKLRGILKPEIGVFMDMKSGTIGNKEMINRLPIGSELPGFAYATDICIKCGLIYAVRIETHKVKKQPGLTIPEIKLASLGMN